MLKAKIDEVFSSIQGEGIYQGKKQVFVRFFGCNLHCSFCDTPQNDFQEYSSEELFKAIESLDNHSHSISFTGGESLLQKDFLKEIMNLCKWHDKTIYLETNGTLPEALEEVIDLVDIVAMDFKLPSSTGELTFWDEHKKFLTIAGQKEVFVKTVVCKSTQETDIISVVETIKCAGRESALVLQPNFFEMSEELTAKIDEYRKYCKQYLQDVRVLPQLHKILSIK